MAGEISDMLSFDNIADDEAIQRRDFISNDTANQISTMMQIPGEGTQAAQDFTSASYATNANTQDSFGDFSPRSDASGQKTNDNSTFNLGSLTKALGKLGASSKNTTTTAKIEPIKTPSPSGTQNNTLDTPTLDDLLKKYRGRSIPSF